MKLQGETHAEYKLFSYVEHVEYIAINNFLENSDDL